MLEVLNRDGAYCPTLTCDQCGEPIRDARNAVAMYPGRAIETPGPRVKVLLLHKGECDRAATATYGDAGGTDQLDTFLARLLHNAGMDETALEGARQMAAMLDSI